MSVPEDAIVASINGVSESMDKSTTTSCIWDELLPMSEIRI